MTDEELDFEYSTAQNTMRSIAAENTRRRSETTAAEI